MTELYRLLHASAHDIPLPDGSVQMIVTSPPYWGLRAYAGEQGVEWPAVTYRLNEWTEPVTVPAMRSPLGLEPSPVAFVGHLILCLREWRRILRDDGVAFVNIGDSYNDSGGAGGDYAAGGLREGQPKYGRKDSDGLKPKDLCGIPWTFALAARADGWWLRSDVIWAKGRDGDSELYEAVGTGSAMPDSSKDKPAPTHEYIFLLAKSARYYYDDEAVRVKWGDDKSHRLRSVWYLNTSGTSIPHFATFPERLPELCIRAGTSARGACPECGAPWARLVERTAHAVNEKESAAQRLRCAGVISGGTNNVTLGVTDQVERTTTGWRPTCEHDVEPVPCVVCDPFHGSGTTGIVALREGRAYVGVDISAEYLENVTSQRMGAGAQIGMSL